MSDVSVPTIHPDDEVVTRRMLREELSKHPTREELREELSKHPTREELSKFAADLSGQLKAMEEHLIAQMAKLVEPTSDHESRLTKVEARTSILIDRVDTLEAQRAVRRPAKRTKPRSRKTTRK